MATAQQKNTIQATVLAMEHQKPFSWIKTRDVQAGVYIKHTQQFFQTYRMGSK